MSFLRHLGRDFQIALEQNKPTIIIRAMQAKQRVKHQAQ